MSNILSLDTTLGGCSVALSNGASRHIVERNQQTSQLSAMVEAVLVEDNLSFDDLDAYAVTIGPGSFTGVRIGLAFVRGLALAVKKPIHSISGLELLAYQAIEAGVEGTILAAINAYREHVYRQHFKIENGLPVALSKPFELPNTDSAPADSTVVGDAGEFFPGHPQLTLLPDAAALARYAEKLPLPALHSKPAPLYLRAPDAKVQNGNLTIAQ
ncbi:MAG: tRNA (adenosine(37)-N6)-threonylcarbamoyltransferase complex dimerization subunit type 1 TsaB [Rickettsiales bacterium]|nr:tRNA (adenosine(37)-N6)-threonylcarbamoyltransferase complex dimerization subunit type 1 TsaB [Rickettsiales bacterium]